MKKYIRSLFNFFGYDVTKKENLLRSKNFNNLCVAYEYLFGKYFGKVKNNNKRLFLIQRLLGTQPSEAYFIINLLEKTEKIDGDVCEFGIAQGETSALIANEIRLTKKKLHLFDSFEGLPKPTEKDILKDDIDGLGNISAYKGTMSSPEEMVARRLKSVRFPKSRYIIHKGFIEDLVREKNGFPGEISFSYLDFDFYKPTKITLDFLDKVTGRGSVVLVDDYDFFSTGVKTAVDEFISEKNKHTEKYKLSVPDKVFGHFAIIVKQ